MLTTRFAPAFVTVLLALAAPPGLADEVRLGNGDRLIGVALRCAKSARNWFSGRPTRAK